MISRINAILLECAYWLDAMLVYTINSMSLWRLKLRAKSRGYRVTGKLRNMKIDVVVNGKPAARSVSIVKQKSMSWSWSETLIIFRAIKDDERLPLRAIWYNGMYLRKVYKVEREKNPLDSKGILQLLNWLEGCSDPEDFKQGAIDAP